MSDKQEMPDEIYVFTNNGKLPSSNKWYMWHPSSDCWDCDNAEYHSDAKYQALVDKHEQELEAIIAWAKADKKIGEFCDHCDNGIDEAECSCMQDLSDVREACKELYLIADIEDK